MRKKRVSPKEFDRWIERALREIPAKFRPHLENVMVVSEARPSKELLKDMGMEPDEALYGVYEGTNMLERGHEDPVFPDKITIFREPLLEDFGDDEDALVEEIRITVIHEIGHFFGLEEEEMGDYA
ncbi:MAG: metallopeptidase family protein [Planctomycetes bacterium]|nr:metallopeptidase family protein [Planctomycetota bacterium]